METWHYLLAIGAGFCAGVINTLAGSGSLFTLPVLLFLGLPIHIANGTNRVGILTQTLAAAITFYRSGKFKIGTDVYYIIPTVLGSAAGAYIASSIDEDVLRISVAILMLLLLAIILLNYSSLLRESDVSVSRTKKIIAYPVLFFVGMYGGYIQLGVGIFTLAALLLVLNYTFQHSNALKNIMNFFLTVPAFLIFAFNGQINWELGCVIAIGQTFGAWIAAKYASENKSAAIWIRRLLVVMALISSLKLFGII